MNESKPVDLELIDKAMVTEGHDIGHYDDSDTVGNIKAVLEHLGYEVET